MTKKSPDKIIQEWQTHINAIPILQFSLKQQGQQGGCKICAKATKIFIAINEILQGMLKDGSFYKTDKETFANILDIYNEWHTVAMEAVSLMSDAGHKQILEAGTELPPLCAVKKKEETTKNKNLLN